MIEELRTIPALEGLENSALEWLVKNGDILNFAVDDAIFKPGDPVDRMLIVLEGRLVLKMHQGNQYRVVGEIGAGSITGLLPYSRAKSAVGMAQVIEPVKILSIGGDKFHDMIITQEELTTVLVHLMSSRIREFTKNQQQNDKMMALGKLSAGLAHELNNPSAAIVRSAQTLSTHLKQGPDIFMQAVKVQMTDEQIKAVNEVLVGRIAKGVQSYSLMEKAEKEDEVMDWLDDHEIEDSDSMAENLVDYGFGPEELDRVADEVEQKYLSGMLAWINQNLVTERLVDEIEEASSRINKLVSSVKSYTHMDQAPEKKPTDIHVGIENTLTMLAHKIKKSNIQVHRSFDPNLPKVFVFPSEMNQVWTNIIDNAIDAMENSENKELSITTTCNSQFINVMISDTGSGIPEEVQDKIFDPFFTTKEIGKGTGMGMEVVHRIVTNQHNGSVTFLTEPGHTEFSVCFPLN